MILLFFLSPGGGFRSRRPPPLVMLLGILPWLQSWRLPLDDLRQVHAQEAKVRFPAPEDVFAW